MFGPQSKNSYFSSLREFYSAVPCEISIIVRSEVTGETRAEMKGGKGGCLEEGRRRGRQGGGTPHPDLHKIFATQNTVTFDISESSHASRTCLGSTLRIKEVRLAAPIDSIENYGFQLSSSIIASKLVTICLRETLEETS